MQLQTQFKAVGNHAFIDLPSATQDGYQLASGIYVQPDTSDRRIEDSAAVIGTVLSVPDGGLWIVANEHTPNEYRIPIEIKDGDKVAVDYRVVGEGDWVGDDFHHNNCWLIKDKMCWKAEPYSMLAKWVTHYTIDLDALEDLDLSKEDMIKLMYDRGNSIYKPVAKGAYDGADGYWQALGDVVLLKKITTPKYESSLIIIPDMAKDREEKNVATHVSGLDIPQGTKVFFNPMFMSTYLFEGGEEMIVIRRDYVFGTIN